jgi:fermentation-respiration switch protein FrsA (DUF1100 family)
MNPTTLHSTTIGDHLHRIARAITPLVALAYVAGYALGDWIHWLNDRLAGRGRERWAAPARPWPAALSSAQQRLLQPGPGWLIVPSHSRPASARLVMVLPRHAGKVPVIDEEATLRFVSQFTGPIHHLTVPQLRRLARERGLSRQLYTYGRRADLIEALNQ